MDFLGKIEAYLPEGKVEYDIEDGEVFTEEDFDSLTEQGAWDNDVDDINPMIKEGISKSISQQKPASKVSSKSKSRKVEKLGENLHHKAG